MKYNIALLGFGGVNRAFVEIVRDKADVFQTEFGVEIAIVGVSDIFTGSAFNADGIDLKLLANIPLEKGALVALPGGHSEPANMDLINNPAVDVIMEATFTDPTNGEPATSHCRQALSQGKYVITSNKGPIALYLDELNALAKNNDVELLYEGAVLSGTPVIRLAKDALKGVGFRGARGIMNGTANFILGQMEAGSNYEDALNVAQVLGYAEADPTADVEGFDVMLKVIILANSIFGVNLSAKQVTREGIANLSEDQVRKAVADGKHWKLIGELKMDDAGNVQASVGPQLLEATDPLASVSGPLNAISFDTEMLGPVTISGPGAGKTETAFALLADLLSLNGSKSGLVT